MDTKKEKRKILRGFLPAVGLLALGAVIGIFATAYQYSGLICMGLGLVTGCYSGLRRLRVRHVVGAKLLWLLLTTLVLLCVLAGLVTGTRIAWASEGHAGVGCRYLVVLGAGVDGTVPSQSLRERLDAAYAYLVAHPQTICVVSGGQGGGELISEAECMARELTRKGVDPDRIWMEAQAENTGENIRLSLNLIEARTGQRPTQIALVTSEYHLYRAEKIAWREGVAAVGIPAKTSRWTLRWNYFLREIAAVWYYGIFGG